MNIQKLIDQTRDIYDNHEHTTTVMDALDYLEQIAKKEEELRVNAVKKEIQIKIVKSIKDDFGEHVGPCTVDLDNLQLTDVLDWADGVKAALYTEDLSGRVSEKEAEVAMAILNAASR